MVFHVSRGLFRIFLKFLLQKQFRVSHFSEATGQQVPNLPAVQSKSMVSVSISRLVTGMNGLIREKMYEKNTPTQGVTGRFRYRSHVMFHICVLPFIATTFRENGLKSK